MVRESADKPVKIVIAHRGACGYLPEHTLPAKAYAYAVGSDFLEQDVVLTKDDVPVVLHDTQIDSVTNVARQFPDRKREDGRYYAIDLTLAELKTLRVSERFHHASGQRVFPGRFPAWKSEFSIPTLAEEIEFVQGLNSSTGKNVGIYPEIKKPAWHREQGKDISRIVLDTVMQYGYNDKSDAIFVQCFDIAETRRMREELDCHLPLIQLLGPATAEGQGSGYASLLTKPGLEMLASYADGIGPRMDQVVVPEEGNGYSKTSLVEFAHALNLEVHPYTLRADALPSYAESFDHLVSIMFVEADVDGVFSDFPDLAVKRRDQKV